MSRKPIQPNAENCSLEELKIAVKAAPSLRSHRRLLAVKMLLMDLAPATVAEIFAISRNTLRRWVGRFNAQGLDGLIERPRPGRPRKISAKQSARYRELIEHPDQADQTHWTAKKFHGYLREELGHQVGYRTVVRWLHDNDFRLKVPQPWPDRQDEEQRRSFVERLQGWLADPSIELWYQDEMGVEGDPRPRRRWAKKGVKARVTKNGDHVRMNVCGAICPRTGQCYALEFTHSDRDCFQVFLDQANADVTFERPRNLMICDNASWHKSKTLNWGRFEPVFLPPYSPDLNPIERLWLLIKAEWFTDFIAKTREQLCERLDQALCWAMDRGTQNRKTCSIRTKL